MLISPTEPKELRELGTTSPVPEDYGADFLLASPAFGLVGVQRKEFSDLISSLADGRLSEQLGKMVSLDVGLVLVEGEPRWSTGGESLRFPGITRSQYRAVMWSAQSRGYWTTTTSTLADTIECLSGLRNWLSKSNHHSLRTRRGPAVKWGRPKNRDYAIHLLTALPGVGGELAGRIYDSVGLPLSWGVDEEALCQIPGIGKGKAKKLLELFDSGSSAARDVS